MTTKSAFCIHIYRHIFHENYTTIWDIITKLYVWMYHGCVTMSEAISDDYGIDDVIKSENR